jgi:pimeloyl-ACP methyl ester carboxylesterase
MGWTGDIGKEQGIQIEAGRVSLDALLGVPPEPQAVALFAHCSAGSRSSQPARFLARSLALDGFATLLLDLLTPPEELLDQELGHLRFDVALLARRVVAATEWLSCEPDLRRLPLSYVGATTGAAAALVAAAERGPAITAVVSRGGRPDLAGPMLSRVTAPTLLIVGGHDLGLVELNRKALGRLRAEAHLQVLPGASHLVEEIGSLDDVARLTVGWLRRYGTVRRRAA